MIKETWRKVAPWLPPTLVVCLARLATGRYEAARGYGYHECVRVMIWVGVGLIVLEGALIDGILVLALPGTPWIWVALGLHVYALVWVLGFYASLVTRPHLLDRDALRLRQGVLTEVVVPYSAIVQARVGTYPDHAHSWFKVDTERAAATIAYGEANVALTLDPDEPILVRGRPCDTSVATLYVTVDSPREFLDALADALADARQVAQEA